MAVSVPLVPIFALEFSLAQIIDFVLKNSVKGPIEGLAVKTSAILDFIECKGQL